MPDEHDPAPSAWFLAPDERGNPATTIDRGRAAAWTDGNRAWVHVDGADYYRHLLRALCASRPGDTVMFTDWEGDGDERLDGPGTEVATVLGTLAKTGVAVRGLLWRSHVELANFSEGANLDLARDLNAAARAEVLLDHRVRRGGSHHQKLVIVRRALADDDVAFVGGIDLSHGRRDDRRHAGDPQPVELAGDHYGERPPWHDVQLEVRGPAVSDLELTFRERWEDPTPLDTRNPWRAALHRVARKPSTPSALPPPVERDGDGPLAVQVLRTYPARRKRYPFAPRGERSIGRAYVKAFERARSLVYLEDQYLWSFHAARCITGALRRAPELRVAVVIPRYPDPDGLVAGPASRYGRWYVIDQLVRAGGDRVAVFDLENDAATPIYVHSKVCVVDDAWVAVGSDNLNRRSWTHDSELSCAVIDHRHDEREPLDPAGRGEGARRFARDLRLGLTAEHLGRSPSDVDDLADPIAWFDALRDGAGALDRWHARGKVGTRPPAHLRAHPTERVQRWQRVGHGAAHRLLLDPDGRPRALRRTDSL